MSWRVADDPGGSDHFPIFITVNDSPPETSRRPRWLYGRTDWERYDESIRNICQENPPHSLEELTSNIIRAANLAIPKSRSNPGPRPLHWWSPETKAAIKARRKALRTAKRLPHGHSERREPLKPTELPETNAVKPSVKQRKRVGKASWTKLTQISHAPKSGRGSTLSEETDVPEVLPSGARMDSPETQRQLQTSSATTLSRCPALRPTTMISGTVTASLPPASRT